jgi:hypothetical protein
MNKDPTERKFKSKIIPPNTIYACEDPEFIGKMPIRQDILVLPADEPKQLKLGWIVSEMIGIGIVNPRGVKPEKTVYICG